MTILKPLKECMCMDMYSYDIPWQLTCSTSPNFYNCQIYSQNWLLLHGKKNKIVKTPIQPQHNPNLTTTQLELGMTRKLLCTIKPSCAASFPPETLNIGSEQCRAILSYLGMFWWLPQLCTSIMNHTPAQRAAVIFLPIVILLFQ